MLELHLDTLPGTALLVQACLCVVHDWTRVGWGGVHSAGDGSFSHASCECWPTKEEEKDMRGFHRG